MFFDACCLTEKLSREPENEEDVDSLPSLSAASATVSSETTLPAPSLSLFAATATASSASAAAPSLSSFAGNATASSENAARQLPVLPRPKAKPNAAAPAVLLAEAADKDSRAKPAQQFSETPVPLKLSRDPGGSYGLALEVQPLPNLTLGSVTRDLELPSTGDEVLQVREVTSANGEVAAGDIIVKVTRMNSMDVSKVRSTPTQALEWMRVATEIECLVLKQQ
eukprot:TRINITY_DN22492_c0_g1_i1.p1 TRINITY_DN22492_c0_g1~~TRINITY_DN22492_c0_g1_i1.p1  ORF type:complete len:224 (+),score=46.53 TRINITY_DN22492_c0_g1_i1:56-727(+)